MSDLDKLKELLFGEEQQKLASITDRIEQREVRTVDVADVLAESVHQSHTKSGELVESLKEPVGECLQEAFREDPQTYSDALYPVMGPAIRKSIAHALKSFSQQINQAVEQSLTPKGIKWRLQASRAGIPFGEFMLQKSLLYRIEQAYLISRENGLLIEHVHHSASKIKDSDAVSAMFIAIQDFVKESFSTDRTGRLESVDMGEFTLWAMHGPHALLVCVIRGVPPRSLRGHLSAILERIHFRSGEAIRHYSGNPESVSGIAEELQKCLGYEAQQDKDTKAGLNWPVIIFVLLLTGFLIYWGVGKWQGVQQISALKQKLQETPGLYISEVSQQGDQFVIRGLRDPLAPTVIEIVDEFGIEERNLTINVNPFQSLEPELIAKRVARIFTDYDFLRYEISGSTILVIGNASNEQVQLVRNQLLALTGIDQVKVSGVSDGVLEVLQRDVIAMSGATFLFTKDAAFAPNQVERLRQFALALQQLKRRADNVGHSLSVTLIGSTDNTGGVLLNERIANERTRVVAEILSEYGVQDSRFEVLHSSKEDLAERKVIIELALVPHPDQR